ncbi:hypothetical protein [Actinomadura alba]|uniref:Uncharacterized protein n=1 Tax=Actinomadura alba TaxID=406431 RepID=A0ABR7LQG2_9ACTN|nr:hypothetical protein [Actinomadura alba]MBC6466991.1 hypothetical protein [Actinomadura alba]
MGEISLTGRFGFVVCSAAVMGGGVLTQGTAEATTAPEIAIARNIVAKNPDNDSFENESQVSGRGNSVTANSPTKNIGAQHNSSNNKGGAVTFQYGLCKRVKNCRISQRVVVKRRFVGFSGPPKMLTERVARQSGFHFFWGDTRATTIQNPAMTSLSVQNP